MRKKFIIPITTFIGGLIVGLFLSQSLSSSPVPPLDKAYHNAMYTSGILMRFEEGKDDSLRDVLNCRLDKEIIALSKATENSPETKMKDRAEQLMSNIAWFRQEYPSETAFKDSVQAQNILDQVDLPKFNRTSGLSIPGTTPVN